MATKRPVGRPKQFARADALRAALHVFWAKGYASASLKDLTAAMGISPPSLYATFGDKHALYLEAIALYTKDHGCAPLVAFEGEPDIHRAVPAFMAAAISHATTAQAGEPPGEPRGCFLSACVATSAGTDAVVRAQLRDAIDDTDTRIAARFEAERAAGTLPADFPCLERARLMLDLRQGHVFRARAGIPAAQLADDIASRARLVLAPVSA